MFDFDDLFDREGHEDCPVMPMVMSAMMMPKP